jgi:hypothetical protein
MKADYQAGWATAFPAATATPLDPAGGGMIRPSISTSE